MEEARFDQLTRGVAGLTTRRGTLAGLLGGDFPPTGERFVK